MLDDMEEYDVRMWVGRYRKNPKNSDTQKIAVIILN